MSTVGSGLLVFILLNSMALHLQSAIIEGPRNTTFFPNQGSIILKCNATVGVPIWMVNGSAYTLNELSQGELPGHNRTGPNIIIQTPVNNTMYVCESLISTDHVIQSEAAFVYIAGAPNTVPDFEVVDDSIALDRNSVNFTLRWEEPFNNFDSILAYTVECLGDITCPPDFNAIDNTTRNYSVTNLIPATNYTFLVVAINSIDESLPAILAITAPSAPGRLSGVMLACKPAYLYNLCTVSWEPLTVGNGPLDQPLVYEVYYKGIIMEVPSPTATLTFIAPSLPDNVFAENLTIVMTAVNRFGFAPITVSNTIELVASSVINATAALSLPFINKELHSIIVICTIHPDSEADGCEVIAVGGDVNITSIAPVINGVAAVIVDGLTCEVVYTILAGGTINGVLVGPTSSYGTIVSGPCPITITPILSPSYASGSNIVVNQYVTYFPSQGSFNVTCNVTDQVPLWRVNDVTYTVNQLDDGSLPGHSQAITAGKSTLLVNSPVNSTKYICFVTEDDMDILSVPVIINIAGVPSKVLVISVTNQFIDNDGDEVTVMISWEEPFDNFDSIISYTVSCSGRSACPAAVTVYNATSINLTNLMTRTMYTVSVIATNFIGDGEAGLLNITTASIPDKVSGVDLVCYPVNLIVECSAEWEVMGNFTNTESVQYNIYYSEAMFNFTTVNTSLVFQAQPVIDDIYVDNVTISVTAINQFGIGEPSNVVAVKIFASSVTNVIAVLDAPNQYKDTHSISITCTVHPKSEVDLCEAVLISSGNLTIIGNSPINNGMATIAFDGLNCSVVYHITAGGLLNGTLIGPRSFYGTITAGPCPLNSITTISATDDTFSGGFVGGFVGTIVGTVIQATAFIFIYFLIRRYYLNNNNDIDDNIQTNLAELTAYVKKNENVLPNDDDHAEDVHLPLNHFRLENIRHENIRHVDIDDDDDDAYNDIREFNPNINTDLEENHSDMSTHRPPMETNFIGENDSTGSSSLQPQQNAEDLPWFHGNISRDEVLRRLNAAKSGLFIIRESSSRPGDYALSVSYEDGVFHYIIKTNENNQVYFENSREHFDSLSLLVEYYKRNQYNLPVKLRIPVDKNEIIQVLHEINEAKQAKQDELIAQQRPPQR